MVTRGFTGRQQTPDIAKRLPPGQSLTADFPGALGRPDAAYQPRRLDLHAQGWPEAGPNGAGRSSTLCRRPTRSATSIASPNGRSSTRPGTACWSTIFSPKPASTAADRFMLAHSFDGYSTNVPVADLVGGKAMVATRYEGEPLAPEHGGPARLLVPHLYFWKSAKWVSGLQFTESDEAGLLGAARLSHLRRPLARAALHR